MDGFQLRMAEGDDVSVVQISARGHGGFLQLEAEHAALFRRFVNPELIGLVGVGLQTELLQHERIAEDMVQMQMGIPVSYTHLDVYKRQMLSIQYPSALASGMREATKVTIPMQTAMAVSYTHLL